MEVESSLSDFNRKSNNVGRFKGGLWEKYIAHEQAHSCDHRWPKRNMGHM